MKSSNTVGIDKYFGEPVSTIQDAQTNGTTHKKQWDDPQNRAPNVCKQAIHGQRSCSMATARYTQPCTSMNSRVKCTRNPNTCRFTPTRHGSREGSEVPGPHPAVASQVCSRRQAAVSLPQQGCCSASGAVGLMRYVPHNMPEIARKNEHTDTHKPHPAHVCWVRK